MPKKVCDDGSTFANSKEIKQVRLLSFILYQPCILWLAEFSPSFQLNPEDFDCLILT